MRQFAAWNHSQHNFLKRYVQERVLEPGQKPTFQANAVTFLLSAVWHGFYPVHYFVFFLFALIIELSKEFYRLRAVFQGIPPALRSILAFILTQLTMNYAAVLFFLISEDKALAFAKATGYFGIVLILSGHLLVKAIRALGLAGAATQKSKKE